MSYNTSIATPTQSDPATRALRTVMTQTLRQALERHYRRQIQAADGVRMVQGFMGELGPDDAFADMDWGTPRPQSEAERCADRMIERQAEQRASAFGEDVEDALVVTGVNPSVVEVPWVCEVCRTKWTIAMTAGEQLADDVFTCPDCDEDDGSIYGVRLDQ